MQNVCNRVLKYCALIALLSFQGCAHAAPQISRPAASAGRTEPLRIDLDKKTIQSPAWTSTFSDCSDEHYFCMSVPDRFVLVFPKLCANATSEKMATGPFGGLLRVAPMPELAPPSGSYIVKSYPKVLILYYSEQGIAQVRLLKSSPFERDFDPNEYDVSYNVELKGGGALFRCSP